MLGCGLIFQPVLASLLYTQKCTYNNDTIVTLQNILTLQIFHQHLKKKKRMDSRDNTNAAATNDGDDDDNEHEIITIIMIMTTGIR